MKKFLKILFGIVLFLVVIIVSMIGGITWFYSGDTTFNKTVVGRWEGTLSNQEVTVEFIKGDRAIKGYTYGYIDIMKDEKSILSEHIKYKDKKIIYVTEESEKKIELIVHPEMNTMEGKIENLVTDDGNNISGKLILKKLP